jgi:hypothetical protein
MINSRDCDSTANDHLNIATNQILSFSGGES